MALLFVGCGNTNTGKKSNETAKNHSQKAISNNGYGRKEYMAGDLSFTVGSTFKEFADEGFTYSKSVYNQTVEPWGFVKTYANYDSDKKAYASLTLYLLNESDYEQSAYNCRVICVYGETEIKAKNLFETGVTSKNDISAKYDSKDLMPEKTLTYGPVSYSSSKNNLGYGSSFNHIKFKFNTNDNLLEGVQIMCCDNVMSEMKIDDKNSLFDYSPVAAASLLAPYMDTTPYLGEMAINSNSIRLDKKLNTKTFILKLQDVDFDFSNNKETYHTLTAKGVKFLNESQFKDIEPNSGQSVSNDSGVAKIGEKIIFGIGFGNYNSTQTISWKDAVVSEIEIANPIATSSKSPNSTSFDLFGVTEKSTIKDVIDKLGYPSTIESKYKSPNLVKLNYAFVSDNMNAGIDIIVDALNDNIYEINIRARAND